VAGAGEAVAARDGMFCPVEGTLSGMIDEILSTALTAFVGNIQGHTAELSEGAVVNAVGREEARRLMPRLGEIVEEALRVPVDLKTHSYEPRERVAVSIASKHPELSAAAVEAVSLYWHLSTFG
jgi:hypothetical protein